MSYFKDSLGRYVKNQFGRYLRVPPGVSPCYCCCRAVDLVFSGIQTQNIPGFAGGCPHRHFGTANFALSRPASEAVPDNAPEFVRTDCCSYGTVLFDQIGFCNTSSGCNGMTEGELAVHLNKTLHINVRLCPPTSGDLSFAYMFMGGSSTSYLFYWEGVLPSPIGTSQVLPNQNGPFCTPSQLGFGGQLTITYP